MQKSFAQMQPVLAYAARHLDEDVSLSALAVQAGLSPAHLQRVFAAAIGETPKQLTLRLRLARATALLLSGSTSVLNIALACGFESHEAFTRAFRRQFGISPSRYRQRGLVSGKGYAAEHAQVVEKVGHCIGLYHMNQEARIPTHMSYSIAKKELTPQPVLIVRRRVPRSGIAAAIGESLPHIFVFAQKHAIALTGHPLTRYQQTGPGLLTIEPAMRIAASDQKPNVIDPAWTQTSGADEGTGQVIAETLPGGPAAVTMHTGPYDKLQDAYAALETWIEAQGLQPAGPPWESYITDPGDVPDPKDWKTEVFWPVK